jgi:ATP-dependent RNA helicase RhlB
MWAGSDPAHSRALIESNMSKNHLTDVSFDSLDLEPELIDNLAKTGFESCTPIQAEALPLLLSGTDVAGQAQTGTGKTAAFLLATLNHLLTIPASSDRQTRHVRALMVAPTRELAIQIHSDAVQLVGDLPFKLGLVFGGVDYEKQRDELAEGVDILIGTPGRLIDYLKQKVYSLSMLQVVVLDEADRMFDLGFIKDIRFLFHRMPAPTERLSMLFSATLSLRVNELAYEHMNNPVQVEIEPEQVTVDKVRQVIYHVANEDKIAVLIGMLRELRPPRTMVFLNTKWESDRVTRYLDGNGFKAALMTGDVPQRTRLTLLRRFQDGEINILVATDVAARGLHIPDVTHVINFDLPQDAEDYVHRIGRTARAGATGDAISLGCETWVYSLPEIEKYIGNRIPTEQIKPEWMVTPEEPVGERQPPLPRSNSRRPQSKSGGRGRPGQRSNQGGSRGNRQGNNQGTSKSGGEGNSQRSGEANGNTRGNSEGGGQGQRQSKSGSGGGGRAGHQTSRRRGRRRRPASQGTPSPPTTPSQ